MAIFASGFLFTRRICEGYNPPGFQTGRDAGIGPQLDFAVRSRAFRIVWRGELPPTLTSFRSIH